MNYLKQLFKRYISGSTTSDENELIDKWYDESDKLLEPQWLSFQHIEDNRKRAWKELAQRFRFPINDEISKQNRIKQIIRPLAYAAGIALFLAISGIVGYYYIYSPQQTIRQQALISKSYFFTASREQKSILLTDGTLIRLNSSSRLAIINAQYNVDKREVWLDEGEAYFEVAKNPEKPFIVHFGSLQTQVLGTSFNIQSYRELAKKTISVKEGRVRVSAGKNLLDTLTRNKVLVYNVINKTIKTTSYDCQDIAAWNEGKLILDKADFTELRLKLKLTYGVTLRIKGNKLQQAMFTASFSKNEPLTNVLNVLCSLYGIHYLSRDNEIILYE